MVYLSELWRQKILKNPKEDFKKVDEK